MDPWLIILGVVLLVVAAWWWRRRSHRAVITAMRNNKMVALPLFAHPDAVELSEVYHRIRTQTREELKVIDGQRNELRALLAGMTDGVVAVDRRERILSINSAAREMFEVEEDDVRGQMFIEVCRSPGLQDFVKRTLKADAPIIEELKLAAATAEYLLVSGTSYRSPEHKRGAVLVLRDMTRIHRLEGHRSEFVANVSHELKTPITSLKGYAETLLDGALEDADNARDFTKVILRQANRLAALVEDLLQLSRIEREGGIEQQSVNLSHIIDAAIQLCDETASQKKATVRQEYPRDFMVRCNADMIELAVRNLVENAIKYGPEGSEVVVRVDRLVDQVTIAVTDNGPGIGAEHHARLFERFYRVDKARSQSLGGTGLGLAIVKHIAQNHGGQIRVDSIIGSGSTFTVEWPG